jgi:hypothetical protein
LDVPTTVWVDVALDFIEGFRKVNGKSVILTVVDWFSKSTHFLPLGHPYMATSVARVFFNAVVKLHGMPSPIISDRDPVFTGHFWRELFALSGVKLQFSSTFHPQTDGQSEVTTKIITMYLRCLTGDRPRQWLQWLPWAEFCYNSSYQASLKTLPFRVVYGRDPPSLCSYSPGEVRSPAVHNQLRERDEFLMKIRERLEQAQQHHKAMADRKRRDVEFQPGQWVWLCLLHWSIASLNVKGKGKLGPNFYGLFQVMERVGEVAYKLKLPEGTWLHNVFYVGLLKTHCGDPPTKLPGLPPVHHGRACLAPAEVVKSRVARGQQEVLVKWKGLTAAEATWMTVDEFRLVYPSFQLEDELLLQQGRDVMLDISYRRCCKQQEAEGDRSAVDPEAAK